ncbi:MAG: hypothetical protein JWP04_588 [Belnapia sp.]|nr:hypothetical protein [Belnapia sp.]
MENEVRELLVAQLKDAYSAEKQALRAMQKTVRKASDATLKDCITLHIEQSQVQVEKVEQALEALGARPGRVVCEAMRGLVEESTHEMEDYEKGPILDLVIVASMQRIEHYEIAAYGTDIALAQALGEGRVVALLEEILAEEKQTDVKLTEVTQSSLMAAAMGGSAANDAKPAAKRKTS